MLQNPRTLARAQNAFRKINLMADLDTKTKQKYYRDYVDHITKAEIVNTARLKEESVNALAKSGRQFMGGIN